MSMDIKQCIKVLYSTSDIVVIRCFIMFTVVVYFTVPPLNEMSTFFLKYGMSTFLILQTEENEHNHGALNAFSFKMNIIVLTE